MSENQPEEAPQTEAPQAPEPTPEPTPEAPKKEEPKPDPKKVKHRKVPGEKGRGLSLAGNGRKSI